MVLTGEGRLGPNIWPKTPEQAESTESIMKITWGAEANHRRKTSGMTDNPLSSTGKKVKYVYLLLFCYW